MRGHCEVAQILITAGADLDAQNNVRQSLARLSLLLIVCGWMDRMGKPLCTAQQSTISAKWLKS